MQACEHGSCRARAPRPMRFPHSARRAAASMRPRLNKARRRSFAWVGADRSGSGAIEKPDMRRENGTVAPPRSSSKPAPVRFGNPS